MAKQIITGEDGKTYEMKEKKPLYKKKRFIIPVVLILLAIIGSMMGGGDNKEPTNVGTTTTAEETKEEPVEEKKDYELTEVKVTEPDMAGSVSVTGILKNNTDKDKGYVQIEFPVYDENGNKLGTAFDNINDLKAGGTWNFKATSLESMTHEGKVEIKTDEVDVTGF